MIGTYHIRTSAISHIGKVRTNHEDNFFLDNGNFIREDVQKTVSLKTSEGSIQYVHERLQQKSKQAVFAVSDGMGGHNAGETASLIAVKMLSKYKNTILEADSPAKCIERFQGYILQTNKEICRLSKENVSMKGMGATLNALVIFCDKVLCFNLGDSRTYKYDGRELVQLFKDHTEGQRLLDLKLLTEEDLKQFKNRKVLSRYLGYFEYIDNIKADVKEFMLEQKRQWFLLCTDGLTDMLDNNQIESIVKEHFYAGDIIGAQNSLLKAALQGDERGFGGADNITLLIIEVICGE